MVPWALTHGDDFLLALAEGIIASVTHPEREIYPRLKRILRGEERTLVARLPRAGGPYAVVSDHHLLYASAPHDYFGGDGLAPFRNERIYAAMLQWYADRSFTLVENGDVEDLVVTEPEASGAFLGCVVQAIGGRVATRLDAGFRTRQRRRQLLRIHATYAGYYAHLRALFGHGRFYKLIGNHDTELVLPGFREDVAKVLPNAAVTEFLVLEGDGPPIVVCHGHQMDPWTCGARAQKVGESITQSFAWAGQGADRIWLTGDWGPPLTAANVAVRAPTCAPRKRWFSPPKIRHMGERYLLRQLAATFDADRPWLVLGHTHEARLLADERYANSASAGRYQDLVWAVEIGLAGDPTLVAWWVEGDGDAPTLVRGALVADGDALRCAHREALGPLPALPYPARPSAAEVEAQVKAEYPDEPIPWGALAVRALGHLALLGGVAAIAYAAAARILG